MKRTNGLHYLAVLLTMLVAFNSATAQGEKKTVYGLLLDNTRSLEKFFPQIRQVGKGVVARTHKRGAISIFDFNTEREGRDLLALVKPGLGWTQDENTLNNYIDRMQGVGGRTSLLDGIHSMLKELNAKVEADKESFGDKVIILVTDGEDRIERIKRLSKDTREEEDAWRKAVRQLIKSLKESGVKVYAVGFTSELDASGSTLFGGPNDREKAEMFLTKLTKETGGRVIFFKKKTEVESALNELLAL